MNRKITFPELTSLLASRTGESKRTCELFLKNFFASVSAALAEGEQVKIKGLGTFRLNEIESRKSVNVNTGLEFEIPGHRRVSFVAAPSLAERVNEPFQAFESVEVADEVTDEMLEALEIPGELPEQPVTLEEQGGEEQADVPEQAAAPQESEEEESADNQEIEVHEEVVGQPAEEEPAAEKQAEEPSSEKAAEEPAAEEPEGHSFVGGGFSFVGDEPEESDAFSYNLEESEEEIIPVPEENDNESVTEDLKQAENPAVSETVGFEPVAPEPPVIPQPAAPANPVMPAKPVESKPIEPEINKEEGRRDKPVDMSEKKSRNFGWGFVAGLLTCIIVGAVAFALYYNYSRQEQMAQVVAPKDTVTAVAAPAPIDTVVPAADTVAVEKEEPIEPVKEEVSEDKEKEKVADTKPSDSPVYDTITKTRYLTTMAKEHYGNYHLWPYIYEANKSLGHPDRIRPGTKVVVPPLSKLGVNPDNPNDIAAAKRKGVKIYSRYKK